MRYPLRYILAIIVSLAVFFSTPLYAANYQWIQNDWSGGADTNAVASHPGDQTNWAKFFSQDGSLNTSIPGHLSLSLIPTSWTQTSDLVDFDRGTLANLMIVGNGITTTTRYENTSTSVIKTGSWATLNVTSASGGSYIRSNTTNATASLTFTGVEVRWIGMKEPSGGIANVYIDNILKGSVDIYNSTYQYQQTLWSSTGLSNATHTIKIEVTGTHGTHTTFTYVNADAFDVVSITPDPNAYLRLVDGNRTWTQTADLLDFNTGTLTNVQIVGSGTTATTRYENTSTSVIKTGSWTTLNVTSASGGSYIRSNTTNATASLTFTGVEVRWIGMREPAGGIANVYMDNVLQGSVDLYNSTYQYQQTLWSITGLTNAAHTIKIEVTGTHGIHTTFTYVNVDAFDVVSVTPDPNAYLMIANGATSGSYESPSFDTGTGGAIFSSIAWNAVIPSGSNLKFQIAATNDNLTWNFTGPDGTSNTYYVTSGTPVYSGYNGNRYIRYRAYFDRLTTNPSDSPVLNDVTINYGPTSFMNGNYESPSFDTGNGGAIFSSIAWNAVIPAGSGLKFQIATNNDNLTWNFTGPDGASNTYYTVSGTQTYSGHDGNRYIKYRAYFDRQTVNLSDSPVLNDVTIYYNINPATQGLISSPYDTTDITNIINRLMWSETLPSGTDLVLQLRTSPNGTVWGSWYGPHNTTFSASSGVSQITVGSSAGFSIGGYVSLTNSANSSQVEIKKITAINSGTSVTLSSATTYSYSAGSAFTDTYTDPAGTEPINPAHKSGNNDRWFQYRVFLFTTSGTVSPIFIENRIAYAPASFVYQPDGVIEGNGDNGYGTIGSGSGGTASKNVNPGFKFLQPLTYDFRVQNDGSIASTDDTYTVSWNTPSDVSGNWTVYLNDGTTDLTSPVSVSLNAGAEKAYTLKVSPSAYAPGGSVQDIIMDIHSGSDYSKVDSVKASSTVNSIFLSDAIIDGNGDTFYDPANGGTGGTSVLKEGLPGDTITYIVSIQNEGNAQDTYKISLLNNPPAGWKVLINDGSTDYNITNPSNGWITPSVLSLPSVNNFGTYTLKVIPSGAPITTDMILTVYSNGGAAFKDSLTLRAKLNGIYKVDGIINSYTVSGGGCGAINAGDNIYGSTGSGNGGCTGIDIPAGTAKQVTVGIQNEGNLPDKYQIGWNIPTGWDQNSIVMQEKRNNGDIIEYNIPPFNLPTPLAGNPSDYNFGESPFFTFKITAPSGFITGSPAQTIIFNIMSLGDHTKVDSLKAVVNSIDTTPPSAVVLTPGNITAKSIKITWTAPGDDGTSGTASSYDLRISSAPITTDTEFNNAVRIKACKTGESNPGKPAASGSSESCTVSGLFANTDYYVALKSTDDVGNTSAISTCASCPAHTLVSADAILPGNIPDLSVTGSSKDTVTICWTAKADDGADALSGAVTAYDLRYSKRNIVEDSATPGVGEVTFSNAASVTPSGGFLQPRLPGMKECYIVSVENKINLGGGIFDDRTQNTRFYFAVKSLDEARNKSLISNVAGGMTTLTPNAYNMVSVPYHPVSPDDTPVVVFGYDVGAQLYLYGWDSRGPNWTNGCYNGWPQPNNVGSNVCTQLTSVKEGRGYFLWTPPVSTSIDVPSTSTVPAVQDCTDDTLPVPVHFQCYVMLLQDGWNMIGSPFDKEINFSSRDISGNIERGLYIRKTTGSNIDIAKFQDAATAKNWLDSSVYTYNGATYAFETCSQDGIGEPLGTQCSLVFQPWKAYWIRIHGGSSIFELLIPN